MSIGERAKNLLQTSRDKLTRTTGKALGDEEMPVKDQVNEIRGHFRNVGHKVTRTTGKALGDEEMPVKDQLEELKSHVKVASDKVRDALKRLN